MENLLPSYRPMIIKIEQGMAKRTRRKHSAVVKAKEALVALAGDKTLADLSQQFEVHPDQITQWTRQLSNQDADVFTSGKLGDPPINLKTLHAKIGQLPLKNDFLESTLTNAGPLWAQKND